jgi:Na+-transporting methylmalonyl-CoA/oxaloacetate decarboxylase gamma subunit
MSEPRLLCNSSLSRVLLILALLCAVLAGFGAFVVRQKVVPVKTLEDANVSVQAVKDQAAVNQEAAKKV